MIKYNVDIQDLTYDIYGNPLSYRRKTQHHAADTQLGLSKKHVEEYIKCKKDVVYFLENYGYIIDAEKGLMIVKLHQWQKELLNLIKNERKLVCLLPRQVGKSTLLALFISWFIMFHNDKVVGIIANKGSVAKQIFKKVKLVLSYAPHFLKPGVVSEMATSINLDNHSTCVCDTTSEDAFSGWSLNFLLCDETAKIKSTIFEALERSLIPTITKDPNSKLVYTSTPKGLNFYYSIWEKANRGISEFKPFSQPWNCVPGRNEIFKQKIINTHGVDFWEQEYNCTFLSSSFCLFPSFILQSIKTEEPIEQQLDNFLKIFKRPIKDHKYLLTCDVGEGVGNNYSTISVLDITNQPIIQEAVYRCNTIELTMFPFIILKVAEMYNHAVLLVENNSIGQSVVNDLFYDIEYDNMYNDLNRIGMRTTMKTKKAGMSLLVELLKNNGLVIKDFNTLQEMSNFIRKGNSYRHDIGSFDDMVMGLINFAYFTSTQYWRELTEGDIIKEINKKKIEEIIDKDYLPIIFDDGNEITEVTLYDESEEDYSDFLI